MAVIALLVTTVVHADRLEDSMTADEGHLRHPKRDRRQLGVRSAIARVAVLRCQVRMPLIYLHGRVIYHLDPTIFLQDRTCLRVVGRRRMAEAVEVAEVAGEMMSILTFLVTRLPIPMIVHLHEVMEEGGVVAARTPIVMLDRHREEARTKVEAGEAAARTPTEIPTRRRLGEVHIGILTLPGRRHERATATVIESLGTVEVVVVVVEEDMESRGGLGVAVLSGIEIRIGTASVIGRGKMRFGGKGCKTGRGKCIGDEC